MGEAKGRNVTRSLRYEINPKHRNWTHGAGQWTIPEQAEAECFNRSVRANWLVTDTGWGLHRDGSATKFLGLAENHKTPAFMAKFVAGPDRATWHGYPAINDSGRHRPPKEIVSDWMKSNFVSRGAGARLLQGKPCPSP